MTTVCQQFFIWCAIGIGQDGIDVNDVAIRPPVGSYLLQPFVEFIDSIELVGRLPGDWRDGGHEYLGVRSVLDGLLPE